MRLTAAEIAKRAGGVVVSGDPEVLVTSWGFDSRALAPGACFVALRDHRDGHDFVAAAFRAGAHVALIDREVSGLAPSRGGDARPGPGRDRRVAVRRAFRAGSTQPVARRRRHRIDR